MNDIIIRLIPMPSRLKGLVKEDPDGDYNIYIREQDPIETQRETLLHELEHIRRGHLHGGRDVAACEAEAEAAAKRRAPRSADPGRVHEPHRIA